MATVLKQNTYDTIISVMTTELNSLASAGYAISAAMGADATAQALYGDIETVLASLNPTGTPTIDYWFDKSADGTNYEDPGSAAAPPGTAFVGSAPTTTGSAAKRPGIIPNVPLPPGLFKVIAQNNTNVSLGASGNTTKIRPHNLQSV